MLGLVVFAGVSGNDSGSPSASSAGPSGASGANPGAVDGSLLTVPITTLPGVVLGSDAAASKTHLSGALRNGSWGDEVKAVQQRLHDLGFDPGPVDGDFGDGTEQSVWAFEALVAGRTFSEQEGTLTDELWQTMQDPLVFQPRRPGGQGDTHMEIYLDLQVGIVFTDDRPVLITHISSGELDENGDPVKWCEPTTYNTNEYGEPLEEPVTRDECGYSKTPGGVFKFYRRYEGNRVGPLGGMWNPVYFNYGIAVHGAKNVPDAPASHGCIRIPMHIADYFPGLVENGDRVWVWDGKKEPEQQSERDMLPSFNFANPDATTTTSTSTSTSTTVKATTTTVKATTTTVKQTTTTKPTPTTTTSAPPPPAT